MGKDKSACSLCRREGQKLYLKGIKCYTDKCAFGGILAPDFGRSKDSKNSR